MPAFASCVLALLTLIPSAFAGDTQTQRPHWPLQDRPGPTGDPMQDPATFPKSDIPAQAPVKKDRPEQPALESIGTGRFRLSGGWRLQTVVKVPDTIYEISQPGYRNADWHQATVPGTVLTTLVDEGIYPEPTYGLNNMVIPEQLAREDYWYRTEFTLPESLEGRSLTLTFNGINYAAEAWLNGKPIGDIRGAFKRGIFDITKTARIGASNALALRLSPPPHPGIPHEESLVAGSGVPNGGSMTFDGPTFFCTEGWDWIPGIRDRCTGIWQDVILEAGGAVLIGDAQVITTLPLPATDEASVTLQLELQNRSQAPEKIRIRAQFEGVDVSKEMEVAAGVQMITLSPDVFPELRVKNPRLWWPNGYGNPELYHLKLTVEDAHGKLSSEKQIRFGIRQVTYELSAFDSKAVSQRFDFDPTAVPREEWVIDKRNTSLFDEGKAWIPTLREKGIQSPGITPLSDSSTAPFLVIKVNGQPILCKGGNWGLDEALKRVSREKLEPYFRLHRDANITMIRNWCGQNTEEVFFELADEYGLMVWSDFWMSTHNWNQQPGDLKLFLANAEDTIRRFRNHPSIVIWCGRNEGVPPPYLNEGLDALIRQHDGTRYYQPNSNKVNLLDSGPWVYSDPVNFFNRYGLGFSSELGLPNAPTADAIRAMMPEADQWPISDNWAYHDWHQAHHGEVQSFMEAMERQLGAGQSLEDFCRKAQLMNYVAHRAMFEGLHARLWKPSTGRLMWMSHPCWPSTEWQLYTSDYDTNGAYFGAQKGNEALHVQLNLDDRQVVVANTTLKSIGKATVRASIHDLKGKEIAVRTHTLDLPANATTSAFALNAEEATQLPLYFVKLSLVAEGKTLSDNFYWISQREEDLQGLNHLPQVPLTGTARLTQADQIEVEMRNEGQHPALLIKPTLRNDKGERILPAYASDGCFSLLPGESRRFRIQAPGIPEGNLSLTTEGWNLKTSPIPVSR
jgi:hypothetical protein